MDTKLTIRTALLMIFDIIGANLAYGCALWLRFEGFDAIPNEYLSGWLGIVPVFSVCVLVTVIVFKLYTSIWKYVSYLEVMRSFEACLILGVLNAAATLVFTVRMPLSYYVFGWLLMFMVLTGIRLSYRLLRIIKMEHTKREKQLERVLIVGSGEASRTVIRELRAQNPIVSEVVCIADDAEKYRGQYLDGVPVRGVIADVPALVEEYNIDRVIIAIPWAGARRQKEIISAVKSARCKVVILPRLTNIEKVKIIIERVAKIVDTYEPKRDNKISFVGK